MLIKLIHIKEGLRIFKRSLKVRATGFHKYEGDAKEICRQIVDACWNGKFLQTSTGHFNEFWTRDFGMCVESLIRLGYQKEVSKTLEYALKKFHEKNQITTTISPSGEPYNFPRFSVDSIPFLIHAIKIAKRKDLLEKYNKFLIKEVQFFFDKVFDPLTSMVKKNVHFSSIKDHYVRSSSTYDNSVLVMMKNDLKELGLYNPFNHFDLELAIKKNLWGPGYFYEDMKKREVVTGDANTFPHFCKVFKSTEKTDMMKKCLGHIKKEKIDDPFPMKYTRCVPKGGHIFTEKFVNGYEANAIWMHMGLCFLLSLKKLGFDEYKAYLDKYTELIEKHKTFVEVYDKDGNVFSSPFYYADEGMLWAVMYMDLID